MNFEQQEYLASAIVGTFTPQALKAYRELQEMREIDSQRNHDRKLLRKLEAEKQQRYGEPKKIEKLSDFLPKHPKPKGFGK